MFSQERDLNIEGVTSQTMLEYLPCSDKTRSKLLDLMNSHKGHIFTDLSVHMLMVCLILFDSQDDDSSIRWDSYDHWSETDSYYIAVDVPGEFMTRVWTCCAATWRCTALNLSGISRRCPSSFFLQSSLFLMKFHLGAHLCERPSLHIECAEQALDWYAQACQRASKETKTDWCHQ